MAVSKGHDLVHMAEKGSTEHARGQQVVLDSVIDGSLGPFDRIERLVMGDPEFFHNLAAFIDSGLLDKTHGGYDGTGD
jgi:hypothetical protein